MYDTQTRVRLVKRYATNRRRRQQKIWINSLYIGCCALGFLNVSLIAYLGGDVGYRTREDWLFGATMLKSDIASYVVVAVVSFVLAAVITIICMKKQAGEASDKERIGESDD